MSDPVIDSLSTFDVNAEAYFDAAVILDQVCQQRDNRENPDKTPPPCHGLASPRDYLYALSIELVLKAILNYCRLLSIDRLIEKHVISDLIKNVAIALKETDLKYASIFLDKFYAIDTLTESLVEKLTNIIFWASRYPSPSKTILEGFLAEIKIGDGYDAKKLFKRLTQTEILEISTFLVCANNLKKDISIFYAKNAKRLLTTCKL